MNIKEWKQQVKNIESKYLKLVEKANSSDDLDNIKTSCLGRKGEINDVLKHLKDFSIDEKKIAGPIGNQLKKKLTEIFDNKYQTLNMGKVNETLNKETLDLTLPAYPFKTGRKHPLTIAQKKMTDILFKLGFNLTDGPVIEEEFYNFDALNIGKNHPARDEQDTFFVENKIKDDLVLRTHTSNVQIRYMKKNKPPLRIISPGKVFRKDDVDASHTPVFHQIEGLYIDKNVSMADLKQDLTSFMKGLFGDKAEIRFRPSYFPFVEPGVEVDVKCIFCQKGKHCSVCKSTGWIEMLGAGIVHPNVLKNVDIDPEKFSGYAFGMGVERLAMVLFGIKDIRIFYENDVRNLEQF